MLGMGVRYAQVIYCEHAMEWRHEYGELHILSLVSRAPEVSDWESGRSSYTCPADEEKNDAEIFRRVRCLYREVRGANVSSGPLSAGRESFHTFQSRAIGVDGGLEFALTAPLCGIARGT